MDRAALQAKGTWTPIRGCPGRDVLAPAHGRRSPRDLLGADVAISEYRCAGARDLVVLAWPGDGGLRSYRRADGSCRHTLNRHAWNTPEGWARKLAQLGIDCADGVAPVEPA